MATPIGRILLMPKGDYSGSAVYNALDWVRFSGASWVCKLDNTTGIVPPTPPVTSNANWQMLSEDGTVGGWSSLTGKPFDTIGAGLDVNALNELEVVAETTYIPSGTSSDLPISGQGVADALTDYYDKTSIDGQMSTVNGLITGLTNSKADRTEIVHFVDATLLSGSQSYNIANAIFKTTSRIVQVLSDGGYPYKSVDIATDGICTITFSAALTNTLDVSIGISNATGETGTVS